MLDLDDHMPPIQKLCSMHLRNRSTSDGDLFNMLEDGAQGSLQLNFYQFPDQMKRSRSQRILTSRQALQVCVGHDVSARREVLSELDPKPLKVQESLCEESGVSVVGGVPELVSLFRLGGRQLVGSPLAELVVGEDRGRAIEDLQSPNHQTQNHPWSLKTLTAD